MNHWFRILLQCLTAALVGFFMLFYAMLISGAGHGWNSGAFALLALLPVAVWSVVNALRASPNEGLAKGLLAVGSVIVACLVVFTFSADRVGFQKVWAQAVSSVSVALPVALAYFGWIGFAVAAVIRSRSWRIV
jgi:hypothetical protein